MLLAQSVLGQTVQVPEDCLGKVSPCLIHTADNAFQFIYDGQRVTLLREAVLKITFDEKKSNFNLFDGRIILKKIDKNQKLLSINSLPVKSGWQMVSRSNSSLSILDLKSFTLSSYESLNESSGFKLLRADFIDKKEFVGFTKFYFQNLTDYKSFLAGQSRKWKKEFEKQNDTQTKVLLRTIASEQENARIEAQKNTVRASEIKKAREMFFYRTFER